MPFNTKQRMHQMRQANQIRASLESNSLINVQDVETVGGIIQIDESALGLESLKGIEQAESLENGAVESHRLDNVKDQFVKDQITDALTPKADFRPTLVGHRVFVSNIGNIEDPKVQELLNSGLQAVASSPDEVSMAVIHDPADPRLASLPENLREVVTSALENPEVAVLPSTEAFKDLLIASTSPDKFREALKQYKQK